MFVNLLAPGHDIHPCVNMCMPGYLGMVVLVLSHTNVCIQRSSDLNGGMPGESRYAGRKELSLHFFLFSDLILFARLAGELVMGG